MVMLPQRGLQSHSREGLRRSSFLVGYLQFSHQKEREPGTDTAARF
jgi:hypothetical protein